MDTLRVQVDPMLTPDPSNGECTADLLTDTAEENCRNNVRNSLQNWIDELELKYDDCVAAAAANHDSTLPFDDPEEPFPPEAKVTFDDWGCNTNDYGCFYMAELRPFCEIDDFTELSSCQAAGNAIDENADGAVDETGADEGAGVIDPFGDLDALIYCSPATTCGIDMLLKHNVESNIWVFYDEDVEFTLGTHGTGVTGFQVSGLDTGEYSKELFDELSFINGDVITHVNSVALDSWVDVVDVVEDLETLTSWTLTVRRLKAGVWGTRNYSISIYSTFGAAPATTDAENPESNAATGGMPEEPGANDSPAETSSCACQTTGTSPAPAGLAALLVGGLLGRRRRRG